MDIHKIMKDHYDTPIEEMEDLIAWLNETTHLYDLGTPAVSDRRWDDRYYRLVMLEKETGKILPNSPTQSIYFEVKDRLDKITHEHLMLSLDKTKDNDANAEMSDALNKFYKATKATTEEQQKAKCAMAIEVFNLRSKVEDGKVGANDLSAMADRFVNSDKFEFIKTSEDLYLHKTSVEDVEVAIDNFVQKDLQQNAMKAKYDQYQTEQYRNEILNGVNTEAENEREM